MRGVDGAVVNCKKMGVFFWSMEDSEVQRKG